MAMNSRVIVFVLLTLAASDGSSADAISFGFGSNRNGLTGVEEGSVSSEGVTLSVAAGPQGALISEGSPRGLGVNSRGLPGVELADDGGGNGSPIDVNLITGSSTFAGSAESIRFSFDQPGVIVELDFDGISDEAFEHFVLRSAGDPDLYFFDSFQGSQADPSTISVPGDVIFLQEGNTTIDDRSPPLAIPFLAGEEFVLFFGDLPLGEEGNGARWESITIRAIPEPASLVLWMASLAFCSLKRQRKLFFKNSASLRPASRAG